jgi:hypothetical protein
MRRFTPEEEEILLGRLSVNVNYCALWTPESGGELPADGTGWIWLGTTPNDFQPTPAAIAERLAVPPALPEAIHAALVRAQPMFACHRCGVRHVSFYLHMLTHPALQGQIVLTGGYCRNA